mgnify:FL=1
MRYSDSQFNIIDIIGSSGLKCKVRCPHVERGGDDQIASPARRVVTSTISRTLFSSRLQVLPRKFFLTKKGFLCSVPLMGLVYEMWLIAMGCQRGCSPVLEGVYEKYQGKSGDTRTYDQPGNDHMGPDMRNPAPEPQALSKDGPANWCSGCSQGPDGNRMVEGIHTT